jgi:hypothetical protein
VVRCAEHAAAAELIQMPNGQVRYTPRRANRDGDDVSESEAESEAEAHVDVVNRL